MDILKHSIKIFIALPGLLYDNHHENLGFF